MNYRGSGKIYPVSVSMGNYATYTPEILRYTTSPTSAVILHIDGREILVPHEAKRPFRRRFLELARREKRRASDAANRANTAQLAGTALGAALATGGILAIATASTAVGWAALTVTGVGGLIAVAGICFGHIMNAFKNEHEEKMERYTEYAKELES